MSEPGVHPNVVRVQAALHAAGSLARVRLLDESAHTAAQAAAALGVSPGQIASSLIFTISGPDGSGHGVEPLLVVTSGRHRVDTLQVAGVLGVPGLQRADPDLVRSATGFPIGGVPPLGHPAPIRTLIDIALAEHDVVWAAAGLPTAVFPTSYDELLRITGGSPAEVGD